ALRKEDGVPGVGLEVRRSLLDTGRHVGQRGRALLSHDRDCLYRAAVDLRLGGADDFTQIIDAAALEILHGGAGPTIRHVGYVDADEVIEQHAAEMSRRARAG